MKLSELKNALTIRLIENATELFRAKKYYSKEFVEKYIGLTLQRSDFYGREQDNGELRPLAKNKTDFNEDKDVTLLIEGIVVLEKEPVNNGLGEIVYKGYGLVEVDDVVIYDGRAGQITDNTYNLASPTTTTVGDLSANTDITGLTAFEIIEQMTVSYQVPSFTFFSISGQANPVEVGSVISGFKSFLWATSNSANVAEPLTIRDVSNSVDLDNQLVNSGSAAIDIGNLNTSTQRTQQFSIQALNTEGSSLSRVYNISILYPYFYGKVSSGGAAAGSNRPVADQALIDSGTKVVSSSSGNISINFNSASDDYPWFAIPSSNSDKTSWFVTSLNSGSIGGAVSPGGNLFPSPDSLSVTTVNWNGINYDVYIANFQTSVTTPMTIS